VTDLGVKPRACVTGASGFLGSHLVELLVDDGWEVRCLVRKTSNLQWLPAARCRLVFGGLDDVAALKAATQDVGIVFHLAGLTTGLSREDYVRVNVAGTRRLLQCTAEASPSATVLFCSSLAAAGPASHGRPLTESDLPLPIGPYGDSKLMAEHLVSSSGLRHVIVRPPAVYGPRDRDILAVFRLASRGLAPRLGPSDQRLSLVHVRDLAAGMLAAAERGREGQVYYLTDGEIHTWSQITREIASAVNREVRVIPVPRVVGAAVAHATRLAARLSRSRPLLTPERARDLAQPAWICDDARARSDFGYDSRFRLPEGIRQTANWYREQGWL
jgi:dihydroflavonol-4-reductase